MKKQLYTGLIKILLLLPVVSTAQKTSEPIINAVLTGKITDEKRNFPLEGATAQIKGTTNLSTTDHEGKFTLKTGQKLPFTLIVSFVGYQTLEIPATTPEIEIKLKINESKLDEVVVVGYGTQKRKNLTGSVSSVPKENLNQVTSSFDNLLRGAAPGVVVTQSSGQPGATASIRIRGGNSITGGNEPLYVIDGVLVYNDNNNSSAGVPLAGAGLNVLSTINPSDIESIDVLKDASATAIYGSRGANGVIIINTKKGYRGQNNVSYQGYYGSQETGKKIDLLNAKQWGQLRNDIQTGLGQTPSFSQAQLDSLGGAGYDWQSAAFRKAPVQNHQLTFSGGDERSRYSVSANYFGQKGVIIGSDYKRYSARVNYEKNVSAFFRFGVNTTASSAVLNGVTVNNGSATLNTPNALVGVLQQAPVVSIYNTDGSFNITKNPYLAAVNGYVTNPIADLTNTINETKVNRVLGNLFGEYKILKDLTAKVSISADLINTKQNYYAPFTTTNGFSNKGVAAVGAKAVSSWLNENTLNYNTSFGDAHQLSAIVGYTIQSAKGELVSAGANSFINDINTYNALQDGVATKPASDAFESVLRSWLGRINYSLLQKYNFTFSLRADGSSRFGSSHKWGYFPSAGFSWNVSEEKFAKNIKEISELKVRLSGGTTGNQEISDYLALASLGSVNYSFGGNIQTGFAPSRLSNPDLRWEKTAQYDAGFDLGLFGNKVNIVFDAYYKKTTDLLVNVPVPLSTGYTSVLQNIGAVENKGIEIGINTNNIRSANFTWKTNFVYSLNRNKVIEIGNDVKQFFPTVPSGVLQLQQPSVVKVGLPLGAFWGYKTNGIFQAKDDIATLPTLNGPANTKPGDRRYEDISGPEGKPDGKINAAYDKVYLGSAQPTFVASLTNTFTYKNFDLLIFFQGVYGNKIFNALKQQLEIPTLGSNALAALADHWTADNPSNEIARAANSPAAVFSDRYVENGSYLRLKTLSIGYTFPKSVASKIFAKNIKIYFSAQNLLTFTKYTGYDPEVSTYEQSNILPGIDYGAYPGVKTFTAGLNVTF